MGADGRVVRCARRRASSKEIVHTSGGSLLDPVCDVPVLAVWTEEAVVVS